MKQYSQQIRAILVLPFNVTVIIPSILWYCFSYPENNWSPWPILPAIPLGAAGIVLLIWTISLLFKTGKGTLAPWNPTRKLVITGPYAYVRNPMISGVFMILLAEAIATQSSAIFIWFIMFVMINALYFVLSEEPGLRKRFGNEYNEYCKHVPRYIPRRHPWIPEQMPDNK